MNTLERLFFSWMVLATVAAGLNVCLKTQVVENTVYLQCEINQFMFNIEFIDPNGTLYGRCLAPVGSQLTSKKPLDCKRNITLHAENKTVILRLEHPMLGVWTCKHGSGWPNDTVNVTRSLLGSDVRQECTENGNERPIWIPAYMITILCVFLVSHCETVRSWVDDLKGYIGDKMRTVFLRNNQPGDIENERLLPRMSYDKNCFKCNQSVTALCVDCKAYFCATCFQMHQRKHMNHNVCTFSFQAKGNFNVKCDLCESYQSVIICYTHGRILCKKCRCKDSDNKPCERIEISRPKKNGKKEKLSEKIPIEFLKEIDFNIPDQKSETDSSNQRRICGICCLPDTNLLIADTNRKELLWFKEFKYVDKLRLENKPKGLVHLYHRQFAISFPHAKKIIIYELKDNLNLPIFIRNIHLSKYGEPFSMAYSKPNFAVEINEGDSGFIGIFDQQGDCHGEIRKIGAFFTGNTIRLAMDSKKERVFVSALGAKQLICTDYSGKTIWNESISSPRGVLCLPDFCDKTLLLASKRHDIIYKFNTDNGSCEILSMDSHIVKGPRYMSYDKEEKLLYIHVDDGKLYVYKYPTK